MSKQDAPRSLHTSELPSTKCDSLSNDNHERLGSDPAQIALRTYTLALSLSLGPSLIPFLITLFQSHGKVNSIQLKRVLRRELGFDGFAFSMTLAVAGGPMLKSWWKQYWRLDSVRKTVKDVKAEQGTLTKLKAWFAKIAIAPEELETFVFYVLSSSIGLWLLQVGRKRNARSQYPNSLSTSPTLDLTLLLLVRAVDSLLQKLIIHKSALLYSVNKGNRKIRTATNPDLAQAPDGSKQTRERLTSRIDALVFCACSARIMWCFFYKPHRLPQSYVTWIQKLARLDARIIEAIQHLRKGTWSYITGSPVHSSLLQSTTEDLGHPPTWGDPSLLPAYGGLVANEAWKTLNVCGREGVGGIPCEVLHAPFGKRLGLVRSCTANATLRMIKAFGDAMIIYLPVHFFPVLITCPRTLLCPNHLIETLLGALRSSSFLSSFIGLYWYSVCFTRTLVLAKFFPFISHDFWDGPFGCIMAGCLTCGNSIWIENGRRRGEMALYVLPIAIKASLPDRWVKDWNRGLKFAERLAFILSMATLLTAAMHRPDTLRGLSRWALAFITNGPNSGFWKHRRRDSNIPPTPSPPLTPIR